MKIAIITSIKAPYRTLQIEEICKNTSIDMTVYYTKKGKEDRNWEVRNSTNFKEIYLDNISIFDRLGTLNKGLKDIVKHNEVIILGGYEKPTYIVLSMLCRLYRKKYAIIYDGISCNRLNKRENSLKKIIKNLVIKKSSAIWANGTVSKRYFTEVFNYPQEKIYNQYLTIDGDKIKKIGKQKDKIRQEFREKYEIKEDELVLQYAGRLVEVKNMDIVIRAVSLIKDMNITLLITGGGEQEEKLKQLAKELDVKVIITGFIDNQEYLFKHYYMSDAFILPSIYEPWGLVVNEAMYAGLPVIVSDVCGCALDLVKDNINGYLINPSDINDIKNKIINIFSDEAKIKAMGEESKNLIKKFSFQNSAKYFYKMIEERG